MGYLLVLLGIGVLILVHELGHYAAARAAGIPIARFSVGFGPRVWGFRRWGTDFWISAFPLGGYVLPDLASQEDYFRIPLGKRILFALGGPLANLLFPIPLLAAAHAVTGPWTFQHLVLAPFVDAYAMLARFLGSLPMVFSRPDALSGLVGIVTQGGAYVAGGAERALGFAVLLSLNLGVLNLLPIPVLDGGKIAFDVLHRFQPRLLRFATPLTVAGLVLLACVFLYATAWDVYRLLA
jgi:regulator of sigma E protease